MCIENNTQSSSSWPGSILGVKNTGYITIEHRLTNLLFMILRTHNVASFHVCLISQLVEYCAVIAELTGSNSVQA